MRAGRSMSRQCEPTAPPTAKGRRTVDRARVGHRSRGPRDTRAAPTAGILRVSMRTVRAGSINVPQDCSYWKWTSGRRQIRDKMYSQDNSRDEHRGRYREESPRDTRNCHDRHQPPHKSRLRSLSMPKWARAHAGLPHVMTAPPFPNEHPPRRRRRHRHRSAALSQCTLP